MEVFTWKNRIIYIIRTHCLQVPILVTTKRCQIKETDITIVDKSLSLNLAPNLMSGYSFSENLQSDVYKVKGNFATALLPF